MGIDEILYTTFLSFARFINLWLVKSSNESLKINYI